MDKEQARFILSSYRPGNGEIQDKDLAAALSLATDNRELGEWLAKERAMDQAFATALSSIELPDTLREDILGCLVGERQDFPEADGQPEDAAMIGALASVQVPDTLRSNILTAMASSTPAAASPAATAPKGVPIWKRFAIPMAAAAGIALAFMVTRNESQDPLVQNNLPSKRVPIETVPVSFIQTFKSSSFSLDTKQNQPQALIENLQSRSLPCPCCLPPGLENTQSIGCRELVINGRSGSLICFQKDNIGVVHLVIFRRKDVDGSCSNKIAKPCYMTEGDWAVARWQNEDNVFFLIGKTDVEQMKGLF